MGERQLLRASRDLFLRTSRAAAFIAAAALGVCHDWPALRPLLEEVLATIQADQLPAAMRVLVETVDAATREDAILHPPSDLAEWLMFHILSLPGIEGIGDDGEWHLTQIVMRLGGPDVRWLPEALRRWKELEAVSSSGTTLRAISYNGRFSTYVRPIQAADAADAEVIAAVSKVLDFVQDSGTIVYHVPEILHDVDPEGLVVPGAVAERIRAAENADDLRRLARIGGAYAINSVPWRTIALAAIRAATPFGENALRSVHISLGSGGIFSWSGTHGEVPPVFLAAVAEARAALDAEQQVELRPYWQQRLASAEAELRNEQERAKEDRGE